MFAFIGAISIVGAVVQKGLQYRNKGDYVTKPPYKSVEFLIVMRLTLNKKFRLWGGLLLKKIPNFYTSSSTSIFKWVTQGW